MDKTEKIVPAISGMGRRIILRLADFCCYMGFLNGESTEEAEKLSRRLLFNPTETREGKDRPGLFPRSVKIPAGKKKKAYKLLKLAAKKKAEKKKNK